MSRKEFYRLRVGDPLRGSVALLVFCYFVSDPRIAKCQPLQYTDVYHQVTLLYDSTEWWAVTPEPNKCIFRLKGAGAYPYVMSLSSKIPPELKPNLDTAVLAEKMSWEKYGFVLLNYLAEGDNFKVLHLKNEANSVDAIVKVVLHADILCSVSCVWDNRTSRDQVGKAMLLYRSARFQED
jgi:hypothetical protein